LKPVEEERLKDEMERDELWFLSCTASELD